MSTARVPVSAVFIAMAAIVTASIAMTGGQAPAYAAAEQAAADPAAPITPACAWVELSSVPAHNQGAPDSAEALWVLPFTVQDGLQIVLNGRYPHSRYISLQVYKSTGGLFSTNGVASAMADYLINPDPGSVNPWQRTARFARPGRAFTVTLQSDVTPGQANTLPMAPAGTAPGTAGYLAYRVYLPARGDFSRVPLPVVTFTLGGVSTQVPNCPASTTGTTGTALAAAQTTAALRATSTSASVSDASSAQSVPFIRKVPAGFLTNADSGYLTAAITPPSNGDVLVIQGKAPTAARGITPSPWPARGIDMQYWSVCNYLVTAKAPLVVNQLPGGGADDGCRHDSQVAVNWRGDYTIVVGAEAQRAAIEQIPGATFLPFSTAQPTTPEDLLLRDMVVNPHFAEAIQNVPEDGTAASAEAVMGPYYPRAATCPLTTLTSGGSAACLAGAQ